MASSSIIKKLAIGLIKNDADILIRRNSEDEGRNAEPDENDNKWHILETFKSTLATYNLIFEEFTADFT